MSDKNNNKKAEEWFKEGIVFLNSNEYDKAINCFENALKLLDNLGNKKEFEKITKIIEKIKN
ncbi:MAG: tetratricopeptide repeat protein [Promethearchaeia archaeon]